jgi:hypothetical protein
MKQWEDPGDALILQIKASAHLVVLDARGPVEP